MAAIVIFAISNVVSRYPKHGTQVKYVYLCFLCYKMYESMLQRHLSFTLYRVNISIRLLFSLHCVTNRIVFIFRVLNKLITMQQNILKCHAMAQWPPPDKL